MPRRRFYFPNPSHKTSTSEAGPPRWNPDKTACPEDLTLDERDRLLSSSVSEDGDPLNPVRFAVRRVDGELQCFTSRLTIDHGDERIEVHGFPFIPGKPKSPPRVLRRLRDDQVITQAEYRKLVGA